VCACNNYSLRVNLSKLGEVTMSPGREFQSRIVEMHTHHDGMIKLPNTYTPMQDGLAQPDHFSSFIMGREEKGLVNIARIHRFTSLITITCSCCVSLKIYTVHDVTMPLARAVLSHTPLFTT